MDGTAVGREHQLLGVSITKMVNRISSARLVYLDGSASSGDFPLSNTDTFLPGKKVEIFAGSVNEQVSLFNGTVVRQSIKVRGQSASQLVVECRHDAYRMTVGRKNAYFFDQTDSDIISALLDSASLDADVESATVTHKQQVQYDSTDWDFLVARVEACGKGVFTNGKKVRVASLKFGGTPVCTLLYGATILEMDAEMDARNQYPSVKSFTWNPAQQAVAEMEAVDPGQPAPGNVSTDELAAVAGLDHLRLQSVAVTDEEAQAWADAQWLKSKLSKISGRIKCEGIAGVNPGDTVEVDGVGERFSGKILVTGVRQDFDNVQGWKTHLQFGNTEKWFAEEHPVSAPKAAALLPAVSGLQIGVVVSNEDPDGEHRVRVRMPLVSSDEDGTWARVAALDAGSERGFFFRPEVGDEVALGFLNDDPRQAVILGMLHSSANAAPLQGSDDNHEKVYQSRSKMKLYFNDEKKVMQFETPGGNKIVLSEEDKAIKITDMNGNKIEMTQDGISMESSKAITLKAGTEFKMESGTSFSGKAGTELKIESGTSLGIKGGTDLKAEGGVAAELSSGGVTKVKGSLLQLN